MDLDRSDRVAYFNAKRFVCFQLAKILDTLQNPLRRTYQSLVPDGPLTSGRGPYALFDNVTAIFSATPVITRTATYLYACTEWIEDAFKGKELLHAIYSRLLNPTSISLANHIVDVEAGALAPEYFAWNFNSGMAAIDATLAHLVGYRDVVLAGRNVHGGSYQLLHDWYGKRSNLDVAVCWFDGTTAEAFAAALEATRAEHSRSSCRTSRSTPGGASPTSGSAVSARRSSTRPSSKGWASSSTAWLTASAHTSRAPSSTSTGSRSCAGRKGRSSARTRRLGFSTW